MAVSRNETLSLTYLVIKGLRTFNRGTVRPNCVTVKRGQLIDGKLG